LQIDGLICFRRNNSYKRLSSSVETPASESPDGAQGTPRKRGRKRGSGKHSEEDVPSTSFSAADAVSSSKDDGTLALLKARDELNNAIIAADENQRESSRSPRKKHEKAISHFLEEDAELFEKALNAEESLSSVKEESEKQEKEQWVNLGGEADMKVLYSSPYPENIKSVPLFFVCPFCLKPFSEQNSFFVHQDHCLRITPPGREIYRDSTSSLSFFEVDGAEERTYCRNLCLLAMQFLAWKTRHSYQLSRMERKVGGPERPLSDRGLLTYRKYWRSSILCYLRSQKDAHSISLKNMSLATRIHPTDIVNQLLHDNLLVMKDENYYFRTWKRAYKLPLSMLRRRVVDPARINWTPKFDVTSLDPFKLNCYI
ncbi:MOZ/SAS family protein, partial [Ancylostoma caninum]